MDVLNRHGKCKQTTVELVGNVVSAEVEGSGGCVHSCACVGQMQDGDRRLQADHPRALRMGEASAETVSLDIRRCSYGCSWSCITTVHVPVHMSLFLFLVVGSGTAGRMGSVACPLLTETMFHLTARIGCLCGSVRSVGGIDVRTRCDGTWTACHGGHAADS